LKFTLAAMFFNNGKCFAALGISCYYISV
jgi:hypothetical protein